MFNHVPVLGNISHEFYIIVLVFLVVFCVLCLIRLIMGPSVADRLLAANMMGGIVIVIICLASVMLGEDFLLDVGLVYALTSFLAVIIISQIYIGVFRQRHADKKKRESMRRQTEAAPAEEETAAASLQKEDEDERR